MSAKKNYHLRTLLQARELARERCPTDRTMQAVALSKWLIDFFLGEAWFEKRICEHPKGDFFRLIGKDTAAAQNRVVALGEYLFNLQNIEGFRYMVGKLHNPADLEASFCELEVGALLSMWGNRLQFNEEVGETGFDFDISLDWSHGLWLPVEAKCKLNKTDLRRETIYKTLEKAKNQLPENEKSFIFMKVPQEWIQDEGAVNEEGRALIEETCKKFLLLSTRVASIKLYSYVVEPQNGGWDSGFKIHQIDNPSAQFADNWSLPACGNPTWISFFQFVGTVDNPNTII